MRGNLWPVAFVAVFFGLTSLPTLQMLTGLVASPMVDENRTLAPPITKATPVDAIPRIADRWFADHFGLRSFLIRLKTQVDFSVFGMSDRVLVGHDGQLFYRSTVNVEAPAMDTILIENESPALEGIDRLSRALTASGIHTAFIVNMMSDRFYPELLPAAAVPRPKAPRIDDFVAKLAAMHDILFIDSTKILRRTMPQRRIFHRTDFHWNDPAAFEVAKDLVDRMSVDEGKPISAWSHTLAIQNRRISGGIAMFMPLFVPPSEDALFIKQNWDWPVGFSQNTQSPFEYSTFCGASPRLLSPTVFVGDSYLDGMMRAGLQATIVETHRFRWRPGLKLSEIVASLPTDTHWLVVQFIEVSQTAIEAFADKADVDLAIKELGRRHQIAISP